MQEENDFDLIEPVFFSTSRAGTRGPALGRSAQTVQDSRDVKALAAMDVLISCQGGDYTNEIHPKLRASGWNGYWIDAASALRMTSVLSARANARPAHRSAASRVSTSNGAAIM